jgi:hypothetical protein
MKVASLHYRAMRALLPRGLFTYSGPKTGSPEIQELRETAFTKLPTVSNTDLLVSHFLKGKGEPINDYFSAREMQGNIRSDPLMGTGDCILSEFARQYKELATEYLGGPASRILCNVSVDALFRDKPGQIRDDGYDGAVSFHRDFDAWRWLKLFVYLTDVDEGDGHHEIYLGSHLRFPSELKAIKRYLPEELDVHFGAAKKVTGKAGTCFAENTLAFHRGTTPVNNSRLALTAVYFDDSVRGPTYRPIIQRPYWRLIAQ